MPIRICIRRLLTFTAVFTLGATISCSGGSDSGSPTEPGVASVAAVESASAALANDARSEAGVEPRLRFDPALAAVARAHSEAMRDQGFFSHRDPAGQSFDGRLQGSGIVYTTAAENLARVENSGDPATFAHRRFLGNPPHRHNILDPRFTEIGVGAARQGGTWWITQLYVER